jgi:hypothetical protein
MKRVLSASVLFICLLALTGPALLAEVRTRDKAQVKFEGMLGRMMNMFGGKAAREGVVSTSAVKGDRKATFTDTTGRIVDLAEEKVYELDLKKKNYQVTTFEELRQRMREAQEKAERDAEKQQERQEEQEQPKGKEKEVELDFDLKETGQKKSIAGYDTRQVIMTVTVREKGKTLEEGGGLVMTTDSWLGPEIPALKELADFEQRYWKAIAPETAGVSAEQMAAIMALYPTLKQAMERMNKEKVNLEGTPLATTLTVEGVKSKEQMEQQDQSGGGGLGGMLARKVMKRNDNPRATIFTAITETQEVATTIAASDLQIPDGFKEKK